MTTQAFRNSSMTKVSHFRLVRDATSFAAFFFAALFFTPPFAAPQQLPAKKPAARAASKADPQLQEAEDLLKQGNIDQARQKALAVLSANPKSVEAHNLLGIIAVS